MMEQNDEYAIQVAGWLSANPGRRLGEVVASQLQFQGVERVHELQRTDAWSRVSLIGVTGTRSRKMR